MYKLLTATILLFGSINVAAATHTWIRSGVQILDGETLPFVTVIGHIEFGNGYFDAGFNEVANNPYAGSGIAGGIYSNKKTAVELSGACTNPVISQGAKQTTGDNDVTLRWLAAQEMFNSVQARNLWSMYRNALNITIVISGISYAGFQVTYSDGAKETWGVNPGYATSAVKLLDTPMPGSLVPGSGTSNCP